MTADSSIQNALEIIRRNGKYALLQACQILKETDYCNKALNEAARYYAQVTFANVLPIFPALLYLSCKSVGGQPEKTMRLAAPMLVLSAAGDLHDDILDKSTHKLRKKTVYGKFGQETALLLGDALLTQGVTLLNGSCKNLSQPQQEAVGRLVAKSVFEIVSAESLEASLWKKTEVSAEEYFEVIRRKGSVAEVQCLVGGTVGGAEGQSLEDIGRYGRVVGILSTIKDEFMDMQNLPELRQRLQHELPPYPIIYAIQDPAIKRQLTPILRNKVSKTAELQWMAELVLKSEVIGRLRGELADYGRKELATNPLLNNTYGNEASVLLRALVEAV